MIRRRSTEPTATSPRMRPVSQSLLWVASLMLLSGTSLAQDDYLMELEGAMEEVAPIETDPGASTTTPQTTAPVESITPLQQDQFLDQIGAEMEGMESPSGSSVPENARDQFDSDLQDRMPGTFVLYKRLSDDKKAQVFTEYEMSGDYLRVRRKIIELRRAR